MLIVTISKPRWRYMRLIATSSGNSFTHGGHHVAHTLTSRNFFS